MLVFWTLKLVSDATSRKKKMLIEKGTWFQILENFELDIKVHVSSVIYFWGSDKGDEKRAERNQKSKFLDSWRYQVRYQNINFLNSQVKCSRHFTEKSGFSRKGLEFSQKFGWFSAGYQSACFSATQVYFWGNFYYDFELSPILLDLLFICLHCNDIRNRIKSRKLWIFVPRPVT